MFKLLKAGGFMPKIKAVQGGPIPVSLNECDDAGISYTQNMDFDDPAFAEHIRNSDPHAIQAVVEAYLPHILNTAKASGMDPERAEDVAQSTFETFIERASAFEGRSHVRTWLFGILYKKISEARRGMERDRKLDDIEDVVEARFDAAGMWKNPTQVLELYGAELGVHIESCLELLPVKQRMAFVLREVQEMSSEEMCKIFEVTRTNLGVLLYRGRNRLRECLERKGVE